MTTHTRVPWLTLIIVLIVVHVVPAQAALNPDFTAIPRSGVSPLSVQFNDTSTGFIEPVTYLWTFGDGNTSSRQNPLYTYYQPGSFTVKLDITNASGEQATIAQSNYITVEPPLVPDRLNPEFTGTPRAGAAPLTVQFNDISTGFIEPVTYLWTFGDGNTSSRQNPLYTYCQPGSFTVKLDITNASGEQATIEQSKYIAVEPPLIPDRLNPEFTGTPRSGVAPLSVQFNDTSTGSHDQWEWDFGDGNTSSEQKPLYIYTKPGTYNVTLIISQNGGEQATITKNNYISITTVPLVLPVADFFGKPTSGVAPLTVTFSDLSTQNPISWNWSFGDDSLENPTDQNPIHTYNNPGNYTVSLNATNSDGSNTRTRPAYITVNPAADPHVLPVAAPPVADFFGIPTSGVAPLTVTFSDLSMETPLSWNWSFGDGDSANATEQNPIHTYTNPGIYTVLLNVSNATGSDTQTRTEYIKVNTAVVPLVLPVADFSVDPTNGFAPLIVTFTDLSKNTPDSWNWSFGDDSLENTTAQNPTHAYNNPGNYSVSLNATNADGSDTKIVTEFITVSAAPLEPLIPEPLIPTFTGTPTSGPAPLTVQFNDTSTGLHDQWEWDFGDGNTSSEEKPLYIYNEPGSYSIILNVSQAGGDSVSYTQEDYITVVTPLIPVPLNATPLISNFTGIPASGPAPLAVHFNDTSTGQHDQWEWDFGDGNTSSEENPLYIYYEPGSYSITLNVSQTGGESVSSTQDDYITVSAVSSIPPVAEFSGDLTSGVAPLTVTFSDLSTNTPTSWNWSFGDGNSSTIQNISYTYSSAGIYTVSLNSTNDEGSNITIKTNYINVTAASVEPFVEFNGTPTSGAAPLTVQFNDLSTGFVNPVTYFWDFGDGSNSTEHNPVHIYTTSNAENYTVTLNISGNYGKTASIKKSGYISIDVPTIELVITGISPDQSLLSDESSPSDQSLPQAQSLPMRKSILSARSLPQSKSGFQDQSISRDISTQRVLSADNLIVNPPRVNWLLHHGDNEINAFNMIIHSQMYCWTVAVWDDKNNNKPPGTEGRMAEYNNVTFVYVPAPVGKTLQNALRIQSENKYGELGNEVTLSGTSQKIEEGPPMVDPNEPFKYAIHLKQTVGTSDPRLDINRQYRIVITFAASMV
jgi:PKD repeat protein